jgi:hypothetical protein
MKAVPAKLNYQQKRAVRTILEKLGPSRVRQALIGVCPIRYENKGWDNCFLTQAYGPQAWSQIRPTEDTDPVPAIAKDLGVRPTTIERFIALFDDNILDPEGTGEPVLSAELTLLRMSNEWLREQDAEPVRAVAKRINHELEQW